MKLCVRRLAIRATNPLNARSVDIRRLDQQAIFLRADIAHRVSGRRSFAIRALPVLVAENFNYTVN
jgi:hypothetical protein